MNSGAAGRSRRSGRSSLPVCSLVSGRAKRYGITSGQLYAWRQQLTRRIGGEVAQSVASFAHVAVETEQRDATPTAEVPRAASVRRSAPMSLPTASRTRGLIEIMLPGRASVRVDAEVGDRALRCVLGALREP